MYKKIKKKLIIFGIVALVVLLVILQATFKILPFALGGYSTLSISNVQYDGSSKIRIYGVANGAEQLSINFNPSQLNTFLNSQGVQATNSVTGSITLASQTVDFNMVKDTTKNFLSLTTSQVGLFDLCENHIPSGFTYFAYNLESLKKDCVYYQSVGTYSTFTGQSIVNSKVNVNINGASGTLSPSSGDNVLTLNDGKTSIEWVGSLNNYNQITSPFQYAALFQNSQFQKLIDSSSWSSYQNLVTKWQTCMGQATSFNIFKVVLPFSSVAYSQIVSCTSDFNNKVNLLLVDKTSTYTNSIGSGASFTSNALEVSLNTPTTFPTFIITLDASSVGIVPLKGVPKITSCVPTQNINSGDTVNPTLSVQNTGTSPGSFYGSLQCTGGASGVISESYFNAGETKSLPIQITGQNTQSGTANSGCTATVIDRKSGVQDSCSFNVAITYQSGVVCTANSIFCINSHTLRTCSADGKTYADNPCQNGCLVSETGVSSCLASPVNPSNNTQNTCSSCDAFAKSQLVAWIFPSQKCESPKLLGISIMGTVTCVFSYLKLAAVLLVAIFAWLFGFGLFSDILSNSVNKEKTRKLIAFIISMIVAVILATLTYFIFWAGVIVSLIYIVARVAIGFFLKK